MTLNIIISVLIILCIAVAHINYPHQLICSHCVTTTVVCHSTQCHMAIIYHCSIWRTYCIQCMGTTCAFIKNNMERVWWTPNHMWQSLFLWVIFLNHILARVIFFQFLGSPRQYCQFGLSHRTPSLPLPKGLIVFVGSQISNLKCLCSWFVWRVHIASHKPLLGIWYCMTLTTQGQHTKWQLQVAQTSIIDIMTASLITKLLKCDDVKATNHKTTQMQWYESLRKCNYGENIKWCDHLAPHMASSCNLTSIISRLLHKVISYRICVILFLLLRQRLMWGVLLASKIQQVEWVGLGSLMSLRITLVGFCCSPGFLLEIGVGLSWNSRKPAAVEGRDLNGSARRQLR